MKISIITPISTVIYNNCYSIKFPDINGSILILPYHENYLSISNSGQLVISKKNTNLYFNIKKNTIVKFYQNKCYVLADIISKIK